MNKPVVSICCLAYNHEPYIRQCLEGFVMQQTNFPIEVLIHDDASTDNTTAIIKAYEEKYPSIIKPIYQTENQYSKGVKINSVFNFSRAEGEYIAMCEGDDYWTDPLKLQKQVDFMVANTDCTLVSTGTAIHKPSGQKKEYSYKGLKRITATDYLTNTYFISTASLLYKKEILELYKEDWMAKSYAGDFIVKFCALVKGDFGYIPDVTCVYNKGAVGSWSLRKLDRKVIIKEYSDKIRGLYFLFKHNRISEDVLNDKVRRTRQTVFLEEAKSRGGVAGIWFLLLNHRQTSLFKILSYIKQMLKL